jgi:GH24 family phage-related lysozyme (muramidase)
MADTYPIKIENSEYMVSGIGDRMGSPPSARGFNLKAFSLGLKKYEVVYKATEENGYAFIIYAKDDKKLILKGGQGSDHKETVLANSKELQNIRKHSYSDLDDINFLRKVCLSGRAWMVPLKGKNYYFVAIWNTNITSEQNSALNEYLAKLPRDVTYIQMGPLGSDSSSKFGLMRYFSPKITKIQEPEKKLSKKERDFINQAHMRAVQLPAAYAKQLQKLKGMTEQDDASMTNYKANVAYQQYAIKMIPKLEKIKTLGKSKTPIKDIVTQSSVKNVIIGLGNKNFKLKEKLQNLIKYAFTHSDLTNLHQKGKLDVSNWRDTSIDEIIKENSEMAQSDVTKIIKYSDKLQNMFDVDDNLEDWIKAKLNHAADYLSTVRDYLKFYSDSKDNITEKLRKRTALLKTIDNRKRSRKRIKKLNNSSMAMGAVKQINNDAVELNSMLNSDDHLEDWVKAKLNLAGEYLDDVYHHLDHFGTDSRSVDENLTELNYEGGVGIHELMMFYSTANPEQIKNMDSCLNTNDINCVKNLIKSVTGMSMSKINECFFQKNIQFYRDISMAKKLEESWKNLAAAGAIGLGVLSNNPTLAAQPVVKPAITKQADSFDQSFIDYIKTVENAEKLGYDKQKKLWFPHKSFEGGSDTIGYGHKIQSDEDFSKGITDEQVNALLKKDLEKAKAQVYKEIGNRQLTKKQLEIFVDFVFNMGTLKKFPKFKDAVLKNDIDAMKSQYKRYSGGKELKGRNSAFLKRFLSEYFGFNYAID